MCLCVPVVLLSSSSVEEMLGGQTPLHERLVALVQNVFSHHKCQPEDVLDLLQLANLNGGSKVGPSIIQASFN